MSLLLLCCFLAGQEDPNNQAATPGGCAMDVHALNGSFTVYGNIACSLTEHFQCFGTAFTH